MHQTGMFKPLCVYLLCTQYGCLPFPNNWEDIAEYGTHGYSAILQR